MPNEYLKKESNGLKNGKSIAEEGNQTICSNSTEQSDDWKKHWRTPRNVRELATQINEVATLVLNEKIDLEHARAFGALTRNVAQLLSTEFQNARTKQTKIDTNFVMADDD